MRQWAARRIAGAGIAGRARRTGTLTLNLGSPTRVTRRHQSSLAQETSSKRASKSPLSPDSYLSHSSQFSQQSRSTSPSSSTSAQQTKTPVDPYTYLAPELSRLRKTLLHLLGSSHSSLTSIAEYYFLQPSKSIRPLLVLLFARATNGLGGDWDEKLWAAEQEGARGRAEELDSPLSRPDVLNDWNPNMPDHTVSFESTFDLLTPRSRASAPTYPPARAQNTSAPSFAHASSSLLLPTQLRLAQIVEMIHVASLLHDDVIDNAALRRGAPSGPAAFGNKLAVLAGDFLLGRASAALSRLGSAEVVELIAGVIANLVEGEILQMQAAIASGTGDARALSELGLAELGLDNTTQKKKAPARGTPVSREIWNIYLRKSYLKTASLIAKSARAAVVLGGAREGEIWKEVAYAYGRNIGIAFQVRLKSSSCFCFDRTQAKLIIYFFWFRVVWLCCFP